MEKPGKTIECITLQLSNAVLIFAVMCAADTPGSLRTGAQTSSVSDKMPFWPQYPRRLVQVLDGEWQFDLGGNLDPEVVDPSTVMTSQTVTVPSAYDVAPPGECGYRGVAFYRKQIQIRHGAAGLLHFAACSFYCRVYVNNTFIGDHRVGGYSPFWLSVPTAVTGAQTGSAPTGGVQTLDLLVVVDNRFDAERVPTYTGGDFYHYGGITRSVALHELPPPSVTMGAYLHQVAVFTRDATSGLADVTLWLRRPCAGTDGSIPQSAAMPAAPVRPSPPSFLPPLLPSVWLKLEWDGRQPSNMLVQGTVDVGGRVALRGLPVPFARPWSLEAPNLHVLSVSLLDMPPDAPSTAPANATLVDTVVVRFGLRTVGIDARRGRLTLNGRVAKLKGVNRHTMWPDTGAALTIDQVLADVTLLKQLGANFVRGAHYPQDQRFLDLADEAGLAVWEETLGPSVLLDDLRSPAFMAAHLAAVEEMVMASINHPSVILLAFFNEGPSKDPAACNAYNASAAAIRSLVGTWTDTVGGAHGATKAAMVTDATIRVGDSGGAAPHRPFVLDLRESADALGPPPASRLVTWASSAARDDKCLSFADVISFNSYPGWYFGLNTSLDWPAKFWKYQLVSWARTHYPQKPFLISETGAGAIYEWRNASRTPGDGDAPPAGKSGANAGGPLASRVAPGARSTLSLRTSTREKPPRWSQEYQMQLVAGIARYAVEAEAVSGIAFWQMTDTKANDQDTQACGACDYGPHPPDLSSPWDCLYINVTCNRPGGVNHKGLVDFWRRKKIAYNAVAAIFRNAV